LQKPTRTAGSSATSPPFRDEEFHALLSEMTCACARTGRHLDAPMAQALFHRVDVLNESQRSAARALGIETGDAAYLLGGLRQDLATQLALLISTPSVARS